MVGVQMVIFRKITAIVQQSIHFGGSIDSFAFLRVQMKSDDPSREGFAVEVTVAKSWSWEAKPSNSR